MNPAGSFAASPSRICTSNLVVRPYHRESVVGRGILCGPAVRDLLDRPVAPCAAYGKWPSCSPAGCRLSAATLRGRGVDRQRQRVVPSDAGRYAVRALGLQLGEAQPAVQDRVVRGHDHPVRAHGATRLDDLARGASGYVERAVCSNTAEPVLSSTARASPRGIRPAGTRSNRPAALLVAGNGSPGESVSSTGSPACRAASASVSSVSADLVAYVHAGRLRSAQSGEGPSDPGCWLARTRTGDSSSSRWRACRSRCAAATWPGRPNASPSRASLAELAAAFVVWSETALQLARGCLRRPPSRVDHHSAEGFDPA